MFWFWLNSPLFLSQSCYCWVVYIDNDVMFVTFAVFLQQTIIMRTGSLVLHFQLLSLPFHFSLTCIIFGLQSWWPLDFATYWKPLLTSEASRQLFVQLGLDNAWRCLNRALRSSVLFVYCAVVLCITTLALTRKYKASWNSGVAGGNGFIYCLTRYAEHLEITAVTK